MPRKTKKQKMLAQSRKKQDTTVNYLPQQHPPSTSIYSFNPNNYQNPKPVELKKENIESSSIKYITRDLKKTLILTTLAILFVLVLYWGWRF